MTIAELQSRLRGAAVTDVMVAGFIDRAETPLRFRPVLQNIYVTCREVILEMGVVRTTGAMQLSLSHGINFKLELEDGMLPVSMSLRELVLADPDGANELVAIHLWSPKEDSAGLRCLAARIDLANGQEIFVDPTYHFGIRLGGREQQATWTENWPGAHDAQVQTISLRP